MMVKTNVTIKNSNPVLLNKLHILFGRMSSEYPKVMKKA